MLVVAYRRFGPASLSHFQRSSCPYYTYILAYVCYFDCRIVNVYKRYLFSCFRLSFAAVMWERSTVAQSVLKLCPHWNVWGIVVRFPVGIRFNASGTNQSPTQCVPSCLFQGVKCPGREADQTLTSKVKVKNRWICIFISPYAFMTCTGITSPYLWHKGVMLVFSSVDVD